jgi:hypothetical protein
MKADFPLSRQMERVVPYALSERTLANQRVEDNALPSRPEDLANGPRC